MTENNISYKELNQQTNGSFTNKIDSPKNKSHRYEGTLDINNAVRDSLSKDEKSIIKSSIDSNIKLTSSPNNNIMKFKIKLNVNDKYQKNPLNEGENKNDLNTTNQTGISEIVFEKDNISFHLDPNSKRLKNNLESLNTKTINKKGVIDKEKDEVFLTKRDNKTKLKIFAFLILIIALLFLLYELNNY